LHEEQEGLSLFVIFSALLVSGFWIFVYSLSSFYNELYRRSRAKDGLQLITINFLGAIFLFFTLMLDDQGVTNYTEYYKTFALYYSLQTFFSVSARFIVISRIKTLINKGVLFFNTLMVGSGKRVGHLRQELMQSSEPLGLRILGFVSIQDDNRETDRELRNFGSYVNLRKVMRRCYVDVIIIALDPTDHDKITEILALLHGCKVKVEITPDIYELLLGSVKANHLFGVPLIEINQDLIPLWQKFIKRIMDMSFSLFVLIAGCPFFLLLAFLTKTSSKGPVIYHQERVGRNGKLFNIYKFRSMYLDSEEQGPALAKDKDNRVTGWGRIMRRFRLDELPQFYNVLKGDMSLVGPRPERAFFIGQIVKVAPEYRHLQKVRPGLTSLGQVKFGYAGNVEEMVRRLKYDIFYIENMSLAMDFRILFYTIIIILQGRGK
jgi:exopolysaccharide biosynthesis polyprenyl glycosylphosphotransferase